MTARQLHNEVSHYVHTLGGDIERCFNPDFGELDEPFVESPTRTELLIIDEADRLKTSGLGSSSATLSTSTPTTASPPS
jgi:hypothetical protein